MTTPRILVAGIGNIFLGDDAFGVEVAQRLGLRRLPDGVRVVDFGIRGLDLAYAMADDYDAVILVDAHQRGEPPGTLYVIEPEPGDAAAEAGTASPMESSALGQTELGQMEMHGLDPLKVLRLAAVFGGPTKHVLLVGCEPAVLGSPEAMAVGLSEPVRSAVDEAVPLVESLVEKLRSGTCLGVHVPANG
jgi:hydrogenase maturation protease